jgi:anti-sigma regulatory factor (Ser/Thr protein kinase)
MSSDVSAPTLGRHDVLLSLEPVATAPARVRRALQEARLGVELEHTVTLLATELVGNSVRHAGMGEDERIVFFARLAPAHVHVEVGDTGPGFDPEIRHEASGFGLRLMEKLSSRWGTSRDERGSRVWFDVDRRPRRFERA